MGVLGLEEPGRCELCSEGREGVETPPRESRWDGMMDARGIAISMGWGENKIKRPAGGGPESVGRRGAGRRRLSRIKRNTRQET